VNRTAVNLAPLLKELRAAGVPSLNGIAAALNERRVPTPAGSGHCHAAQVAGVEAAAEVSCGTSVTRSPLTVGAGFPPLDRTPAFGSGAWGCGAHAAAVWPLAVTHGTNQIGRLLPP
jgi:hypothetical protein